MEPRHQQHSTRRGGGMNTPAHILQLLLVALLLVASAVLFIVHWNVLAIILMIAGGVIAFLNYRRN